MGQLFLGQSSGETTLSQQLISCRFAQRRHPASPSTLPALDNRVAPRDSSHDGVRALLNETNVHLFVSANVSAITGAGQFNRAL
jgi:hypothetical protein